MLCLASLREKPREELVIAARNHTMAMNSLWKRQDGDYGTFGNANDDYGYQDNEDYDGYESFWWTPVSA